MTEEIKKGIRDLRSAYIIGLSRIAEWNRHVAEMQRAEQWLGWMEESINQSPLVLAYFPDEKLMDYLGLANEENAIIETIPQPPPGQISVYLSTGTAVQEAYHQYVRNAAAFYSDRLEVTHWANETIKVEKGLRDRENRSDIARRRLVQMNTSLGELYSKSVESTLAAQAGTQNPIEAASNQNRLLEQFKGHLINLCRKGKGNNYSRISENLAADSILTKQIVRDGQETYKKLNGEYVSIRKSISPSTGDRLVELLHELEDHIVIITDAIDPDKIEINL